MGTKLFSDLITFTRASSATRIDSSGTLVTMSTNEPRFDYDPVTLTPKGLLIEEQRTNLALYSSTFNNAAWTLTVAGASITATSDISAPDGTMSAWTLASSGSGAQIQQTAAGTSGTAYSGSFWVRRRSGTGAINIRVSENANIQLLNVSSVWQRFSYTATSTSTTIRIGIFLSGASDSVDIWGAQLEAGAFATSYIPTTTAAATRAADVAVMTGTNFSSWYNQTEGTLFGEWTSFTPNGSVSTYSVGFSDNTASSAAAQLVIQNRALSNQIRIWQSTTGGGLDDFCIPESAAFYGKAAVAYGASANVAASANGKSVATISNPLQTSTFNALTIGFASGSTGFINGHIRRIAYYPRRLSNSELQAITS